MHGNFGFARDRWRWVKKTSGKVEPEQIELPAGAKLTVAELEQHCPVKRAGER